MKRRPLHLTFFVTRRCDARCPFCFSRGRADGGGPDLSLAEIERLAPTVGPLLWLAFSRGEPERYRPYPYLHAEMGAAFAAADLVVCRAGASTLGEMPAYGLPAILVPYPHAWRYPYVNADYLARHGAARILPDQDLGTGLLPLVRELLHDTDRLGQMRQAMRSLAKPGASAAIAGLLRGFAGADQPSAFDHGNNPKGVQL